MRPRRKRSMHQKKKASARTWRRRPDSRVAPEWPGSDAWCQHLTKCALQDGFAYALWLGHDMGPDVGPQGLGARGLDAMQVKMLPLAPDIAREVDIYFDLLLDEGRWDRSVLLAAWRRLDHGLFRLSQGRLTPVVKELPPWTVSKTLLERVEEVLGGNGQG
jgi:hypothetical protein